MIGCRWVLVGSWQVFPFVHILKNSRIIHFAKAYSLRYCGEDGAGPFIALEGDELVVPMPGKADGVATLALVTGGDDGGAGFQGGGDAAMGGGVDEGHVGQGHHPAGGIGGGTDAGGEAVAHAVQTFDGGDDFTTFCRQLLGQGVSTGAQDDDDSVAGSLQMPGGGQGEGRAVGQGMTQLVAAEAAAGATGEEQADDGGGADHGVVPGGELLT